MTDLLIRNARLINEGREYDADLLVHNGRIEKIANSIDNCNAEVEIDAAGQFLLPGMIDDQVHWQACREAGLLQAGLFTWERCAQVTASAYRQAIGG